MPIIQKIPAKYTTVQHSRLSCSAFPNGVDMGFVYFGIGFGVFMGLGLFMLVIYPALRERNKDRSDE